MRKLNSIAIGSRAHRRRKLFFTLGNRRIHLATFCGRFVESQTLRVGNRNIKVMPFARQYGSLILKKLGLSLRELEATGKPMRVEFGPFGYDVNFISGDQEFIAVTTSCEPGLLNLSPAFEGIAEFNHRMSFALSRMLVESWRRECNFGESEQMAA